MVQIPRCVRSGRPPAPRGAGARAGQGREVSEGSNALRRNRSLQSACRWPCNTRPMPPRPQLAGRSCRRPMTETGLKARVLPRGGPAARKSAIGFREKRPRLASDGFQKRQRFSSDFGIVAPLHHTDPTGGHRRRDGSTASSNNVRTRCHLHRGPITDAPFSSRNNHGPGASRPTAFQRGHRDVKRGRRPSSLVRPNKIAKLDNASPVRGSILLEPSESASSNTGSIESSLFRP